MKSAFILLAAVILFAVIGHAGTPQPPLVIDRLTEGPFVTFTVGGEKAGAISVRLTDNGTPQLVIEGTTVPAIVIGGERSPADVQITPYPKDRPFMHVQIASEDGTHGDVWIEGTLDVAPRACMVNEDGTQGLPADPRGAVNLCRGPRDGINQDMALARLWRRNADTGLVEEGGRFGLTENGFPFLNGGGNDNPRIRWRFGDDYTKETWWRPFDGKFGELSFDNSGALKYQGPDGTVTTLGGP